MSLDIIENEIKRFLKSPEPEVLAITGKWGIGKTYTWQKLISDNKKLVALNKYSYVSLFGISDISTLKSSIFRNSVNKDNIGNTIGIEGLNDSLYELYFGISKNSVAKILEWMKRKIGLINSIPKLNKIYNFIDEISFMSVNNYIVCLDDFERKGKKIELNEILGLVSILKEQKKCKIVLIFNEKELGFDNNKFQKFREKVIDIHIKFNITSKDASKIALCDLKSKSSIEILKNIKILKIKNIRIIKKIKRLGDELENYLKEYESEVFNQAISSLVLFSWSFYSKSKKIPDITFIKNIGHKMIYDNSKPNNNSDKWKSILRKYNYSTTDNFDLIILNGVENGYFDKKMLLFAADKLNEQFKNNKSKNSFFDAWKLYRNSFDKNENDVIEAIKNSYYENYEYIDILSVDSSVCLFRSLGMEQLADEIALHYVNFLTNQKLDFHPLNNPFFSSLRDDKFKKLIQEIKISDNRNVIDILKKYIKSKCYDTVDVDIFSSESVNGFYQLFKSINGDDFLNLIKAAVEITSTDQRMLSANKNIHDALKKIANESQLNKDRIQGLFGIVT